MRYPGVPQNDQQAEQVNAKPPDVQSLFMVHCEKLGKSLQLLLGNLGSWLSKPKGAPDTMFLDLKWLKAVQPKRKISSNTASCYISCISYIN